MRRILMLALTALGLTSGVALADNGRGFNRSAPTVRDHRASSPQRGFERGFERGREARVESYRNYRVRPAVRFESHSYRRGFDWVAGQWTWSGYEWTWIPGHYIRIGARW